MKNILRYTFVLLSLLLWHATLLVAQQTEEPAKDSTLTQKTLSIDEISSETETLRSRISNLQKVLKPSNEAVEVDSILDSAYVEILANRDSLYAQMEGLSRRELKIRKVNWANHKSSLKNLQGLLNNRVSDITDVNDELTEELNKWAATKAAYTSESESQDVFASLDTMISTLNELISVAHVRLDSVFSIQKRLTELILIVDEVVSEIDRVELQMQKDYFVFDSAPIWRSSSDSTVADTNRYMSKAPSSIKAGFIKNYKEYNAFIDSNFQTFILEIGFLIFVFVLIMLMRRQWHTISIDKKNPLQRQTKVIFESPISSTLVIGALVAAYFYEALIPVFLEAHILLILIATTILLPRITTPKFRTFLWLLLLAYIIEILQVYLVPRSLSARLLLMIETGILILALYKGRKTVLPFPEVFEKTKILFKYIIPVYQLILVASVVLNFIGMVNFSDMLVSGVIHSVGLGMILFLAVKIVTGILVLFFKLRQYNDVKALSILLDNVNRRFQPALIWIGVFLWVMYTLNGFDVYENIHLWFQHTLEMSWQIGDMRISLSSFISFFLIMIVALVVARIMAAIFQDEWLIQMLPRGVAPAISLLLRIIIVSIGLYLAFNAAGFDLTQLGFVLGALGVGIGFGLQNVVLNFIAGLVLAFERPFNLGDTIEIDQEKGVVTSIGVRSSNVRTYSGSEAIIPNGDLISKKVINWTLTNRDRRSKIPMRTAPNANPEEVIKLFNKVASSYEAVFKDPAPKTYFYGYDDNGNLSFALMYWTTFNDTLKTDSAIALAIFKELKALGIEAPMPNQRNFN